MLCEEGFRYCRATGKIGSSRCEVDSSEEAFEALVITGVTDVEVRFVIVYRSPAGAVESGLARLGRGFGVYFAGRRYRFHDEKIAAWVILLNRNLYYLVVLLLFGRRDNLYSNWNGCPGDPEIRRLTGDKPGAGEVLLEQVFRGEACIPSRHEVARNGRNKMRGMHIDTPIAGEPGKPRGPRPVVVGQLENSSR